MRRVKQHLARHRDAFALHPFFAQFEQREPLEALRLAAPGLTFWVMSFQDVLRLNEAAVEDPQLRQIARHHRSEDAGHERWFLEDLAKLGHSAPNALELFGPRHAFTRSAAFGLVSEVFRASDDRLRIVLLLALEATGHVFFGHVAAALQRENVAQNLKYFSDHHLQVEQAHALFEQEVERQFFSQEVSAELQAQAVALLDRVFLHFQVLFNGLRAALSVEPVRPLPAGR